MTRFDIPKEVSPLMLKAGDVFLYGYPKKEWIFKEHRRTRSAATNVADGKNYTVKILDMNTVTVVGKEALKAPKTSVHKKVVTKAGDLTTGDLFVTVGNNKRKSAELFRFVKYGTKSSIIHGKGVIDGSPIRISGFDVIKITDLPF